MSSMAKPAVKPPAQSKPSEQRGISGPSPSITTASSDPPQHKRTTQKGSMSDWLSPSSCLEAKVKVDIPVAGKAVFSSSSSCRIHKKAKKIVKGPQQQARLQRRYFRKGVASAVSETRSVSSSSITRVMPLPTPTPTPTISAKPIAESDAKPLATQAAYTHPLMAADSEADELQNMRMPMPLGEGNIPTEPDFDENYPGMRQVPDLLALRTEQHAVPLESSTDCSSSGWEELSDMFVTNLDDEILCGCGDTSNDGSAFETEMASILGTSDDTLVGGSMYSSEASDGITPTNECGVLRATRLLNGRQKQQQHQHLPERLYQQNQLGIMPQASLSSTSIVSLLQPVSHEHKSQLAFDGDGSGFRPPSRGRVKSGHGVASMAHRVGANTAISSINGLDGGASPICSWTQEAVEEGASTLLAVLADEDTNLSFLGNNAAGAAGAGGQTGPSPRTTWPMNFNTSSDVSVRSLPMALADPCSQQLPSSLQNRNIASHHDRNVAVEPRRWAVSKPNHASF